MKFDTPGRFIRRHIHLAGFALLIAATLALRVGWGWQSARRLAAAEAAIRARGEPATRAEFVVETVPPSEDALPIYLKAAASDTRESPSNDLTVVSGLIAPYPPYGDAWEAAAAASEQNNGKLFELCREARSKDRAQFLTAAPSFSGRSSLNRLRTVANTLGDSALYLHFHGDDAGAVDRLIDLHHLSEITRQDGTVIGQLVATGIGALGQARCQVIAPDLRVEAPPVRERVRQLIALLGDERQMFAGFERSTMIERLMALEVHDTVSAGTFALRPLATGEIVRASERASKQAEAARQTNAAAAFRMSPPDSEEGIVPASLLAPLDSDFPDLSQWFSLNAFSNAFRKYVEQQYRALGGRRATRVALAVQLYRVDHAGKFPKDLSELAPVHLPAVPADPFFDDGRPMGYLVIAGGRPDRGDRPLVYFDPGPKTDNAPDVEPTYGWNYGEKGSVIRQYLDLTRWEPKIRRYDNEKRLAEKQMEDGGTGDCSN